ncbi:SurA N-terminal domain-containing protein [Nocardioides massiliensis]|uniref:Peptidyl-prolyl cis-trans isomerase SurA n=1 Tax=Nocardioides massiliensis TaxID=1325935 RepID=A0ABT9NRD1_9ACTN|nr:SurA N-terminal domain-containing protein [Nocardioides massiliensis]MDP9822871.1 peptidyl-prolyl cis-trans isomerase SurA [Nocardioides massiliensis]
MSQKRTTTVLGVLLAAALLVLSACGGDGDTSAETESAQQETEQTEPSPDTPAPEPDLDDIPDVVAEVNGQEVTRDEFVPAYEAQFRQAAMQAQMTGQEPDADALKEQTATVLVNTVLLRQQADERGISASAQDVQGELAQLAEQNQLGSVEELLAALEEQGSSEELVREQVRDQMTIEQLVADEAGEFDISERELRQLYRQLKQQQGGAAGGEGQPEFPAFAEVRPQLEEQARQQEQGRVAQDLIEQLREDADITVHL